MATKISRRSGTQSESRQLLGGGAAGKAADNVKSAGSRRGTQRSSQMDDIMSGLSQGRKRK